MRSITALPAGSSSRSRQEPTYGCDPAVFVPSGPRLTSRAIGHPMRARRNLLNRRHDATRGLLGVSPLPQKVVRPDEMLWIHVLDTVEELRADVDRRTERVPYPWCVGSPTRQACELAGYCKRSPGCGD